MERRDDFFALKNENKIKKLVIKLTIVSFILLILFGILTYSIEFQLKERKEAQQKIDSLNNYNSAITLQIKDIEKKSIMAKKYIKIWNTEYIPNQKLLKGIDIKDIEAKMQKFASENNMVNVVLDISPTILVGENFERKTLKTYTVLITMKFDTIMDINVFKFLDDIKDIGYFVVIQEILLKRTKKVDDEFLKTLGSGNITSAVSGEIKIRLYGIGEK